MKFDPQQHHRHSIRLKGYDYSNHGAYFVTICSHEKKCIFGNVVDGQMLLNDLGKIVEAEWIKCGELRIDVALHEFVVMPNHLHGIIILHSDIVEADCILPKSTALGKMLAGYKSTVSSKLKRSGFTGDVWQRNYYEHIIRNEEDMNSIVEYIVQNPQNWSKDTLHIAHETESANCYSP